MNLAQLLNSIQFTMKRYNFEPLPTAIYAAVNPSNVPLNNVDNVIQIVHN